MAELKVVDPPDSDRLRAALDFILANSDKIGGFTAKSDARQSGASVHFTFDKKVDVMTSLNFIEIICQAPGRLVNAMRLLLGEPQITEESADG